MGINRFEDLIVWQLATELKRRVAEIIAKPEVRRDGNFCNQIRDSTRSAPSNISEGFGRFMHGEFAHYLRIAAGSLNETKNHLHEALACGYIDGETHTALIRLTKRALKANWRLHDYLKNSDPPNFIK